jgi:nitric oxide reductase NorD protein
MTETAYQHPLMKAYWAQLDTRFKQVEDVFEDVMAEALAILTREDIHHYLDAARLIGKLGRGVEPLLVFLEEWPSVAKALGDEAALPEYMAFIMKMQKSPNGKAILPFLQTLAPVARRLHSRELMGHYLEIALDLMERTTGSIHGHHTTFPSPGLPEFLHPGAVPAVPAQPGRREELGGIRHPQLPHPPRAAEGLFHASSPPTPRRAATGTPRHPVHGRGAQARSLPARPLAGSEQLVPYSTAFDELRKPVPYFDKLGMRVPDVFDERARQGSLPASTATAPLCPHGRPPALDRGPDRRQLEPVPAHGGRVLRGLPRREPADAANTPACAASSWPCTRSPPRKAPAIRKPPPACATAWPCCRAPCSTPTTATATPTCSIFVARFHALMAEGASSTREIADLALSYVAKTRRQSDQFAKVHFDRHGGGLPRRQPPDVEIHRGRRRGGILRRQAQAGAGRGVMGLPPRHYPEWDYKSLTYRPDWVSVYEALHPKGNPADIDRLLEKHDALAKRLKRILDLLKPQDKIRVRYQEEGSELDLDVAIRSLIDFKGGANPDPRINMSHRTDGRNIAVMLLLDLSESLNEKAAGSEQTILELSQEAVSLLAWAVEKLGDPFAIAGFHSNTRHDVRYLHIKGYSEHWGDEVKGRLAAMQAGWSTRMGAAMRHAAPLPGSAPGRQEAHAHPHRRPARDVDAHDERLLIEDTRQAVQGTRPARHLHLLHQPGPQGRRVRERHLRPPVHGDRQHPAPAGTAARTLHGADEIGAPPHALNRRPPPHEPALHSDQLAARLPLPRPVP